MGHFYTDLTGEGKNKQEAIANATDNFIREEGTRHSVRDVTDIRFVKKVPPFGVIRKEGRNEIHDYTVRNENAPQSEWLEVWKFTLHTHA